MVERRIKNSTTFVAMAPTTVASTRGGRGVPSSRIHHLPPTPLPLIPPSTTPKTTITSSKKKIRNFNRLKGPLLPPKTTTTVTRMTSFDLKNGLSSKRSPRNFSRKTEMNKFCVGQHVEIKRSDGRIHGAVIVGFSEEDQLVKVEWYEEGETKGKEVDYFNLLKTNPELNGSSISDHEVPPLATTTTTTNKKQVTISNNNNNSNKIPPSLLSTSITAPATTTKSPVAVRMKTSSQNPKSNSIEVPNRNLRRTMPSEKNFVKNGSSTLNKSFIKSSPKTASSNQKENFEPTTMSINSTTKSSNRDSNGTAVTVSKSRQQSEERRIKNSEAKRQRYIKTEIDKSNPNWQFLSMINDYRAQIDFRPISPSDAVIDNRISVCIRKRPLDKREIGKKEIDVVTVPNKDHVIVHQPQQKVDLTKYLENQKFRFDYAFDEDCDNEIVYQFTAQPLIKTVFEGGYATVFAYGQTGSGKTHTMCGAFLSGGKTQDYTAGIYALTAEDIFQKFSQPECQKLKIKCSFFEIYGSKVFDLLGKRSELRILEDEKRSVQVVGLSEVAVNSPEDVMELIKQGSTQRSAGTTSANANSSRSHAVFQFILRRGVKEEIHGKFSLIDLAGNERGADTNSSDKQTRREGAEINKSLLALKEVIRAMAMGKSHLPFRYSKLTLVLRDSFNNENAKTCMIGMVSPGTNSVENTLNTLRYADRVKELGSDEDGQVSKPLSDAEFMLEEIDDDEFYTKSSPTKHNNHHHSNNHHHHHHQSNHHSQNHHHRSSPPTTMPTVNNNNDLDESLLNKIRNAEERTFEDHHALLTVCDRFEELMQSQNDTDNDVEKYAKHLIATCERGSEAMNNLKDSAKDLLNKLQKEREQTTKKKASKK